MDDKVIKKTQDTLGKIIKKPPMTEKLLNRPPFRFLHDVMTSVIKTTGFMKGLYEDSDLSSDNIKDKEAKIAFLQKAIDLVGMVIGRQVSARPSKIVAGHEPEKTNEFLQALAEAVSKNVNNDEYVSKVLGGEKTDSKGDGKPPSASKKDRNKDRDTSSDRRRRKDKDEKTDRKSSADRKNSAEDSKRSQSKDDRKDRDKDRERSRDRKDRDSAKEREKENKKEEKEGGKEGRDRERQKEDRERRKDKDKKKEKEKEKTDDSAPTKEAEPEAEPTVNGTAGENEEEQPARMPRPTSAKGARRRHKDGRAPPNQKDDDDDEEQRLRDQRREDSDLNNGPTVGEDDLPPQVAAARKLARPSSARPAPPKIKKQDAVDADEEARVGSGKPVSNLIVDDGQNSDDDDTFMVEESAPQAEVVDEPPPSEEVEDTGDHGGLVKKILETKKELEGGAQKPQARKQEIEKPVVSDATRRKEREMVQKEIDRLRGSIQSLTRSANPLGKIMDYVQEDLDSMQKELAMWRRENRQHAQELKAEQSVTESSIEPLRQQLQEVEQAIADQMDLIAASKHNILRNDDKIAKMLASVAKS